MGAVLSRKVVTMDASLIGWGGVHDGQIGRGSWTRISNVPTYIFFFELSAVFLSLHCFLLSSQSDACSGESERRGGYALQGHTGVRGVDPASGVVGADLGSLRASVRGSVRLEGEHTVRKVSLQPWQLLLRRDLLLQAVCGRFSTCTWSICCVGFGP